MEIFGFNSYTDSKQFNGNSGGKSAYMKNPLKVLILIIIICSCSTQKTNSDNYLMLFRDRFPILDGNNWEVLVEMQDSKETTIFATKHFVDTILSVRVHRHILSSDSIVYEFIGAGREFNLGNDLVDYQELDENLNIIYWYKYTRDDERQKFFVSGKYYYQYIEGMLNRNQQEYFLKNKDSLESIIGDSIPNLPDSF